MRVEKIALYSAETEIAAITYEPGSLVVTFETGEAIAFDDVQGFRVLDEGDLLEFWPHCSSKRSALFEVLEGGWFSQESMRPGFISSHLRPELREFFITGSNDCVNVLCFSEPRLKAGAV